MKSVVSLFWFRQDLRLSDNPGLIEASKLGAVLPVYILDDSSASQFKMGGASRVYLYYSLKSLNESLKNSLNVYIGDPKKILFAIIKQYNIKNVFWSRCCEPWRIADDAFIGKKLSDLKINYTIFDASYLWAPEVIKKNDESYYKVFGAYKRKTYFFKPRQPFQKPKNMTLIRDTQNKTDIADLKLVSPFRWQDKIKKNWRYGELAAQKKLDQFLLDCLSGYKKNRDYPAIDKTSKLSVNLHFGEISPNQIWNRINNIRQSQVDQDDIDHFLSEMIWREFSSYLMTYFNGLASENFNPKFNRFPWQHNAKFLRAWQHGNTGYPIVDAGMRELWQTGYMHNRVRMITASFLVKNLMIHWHHGRDWFWDCLVDADLANNSASWQWVAGCGVDAAPYFRIFNPILQGEKFDKNGDYTRKFVPELKKIPNKYLFKPWLAPEALLKSLGVVLGETYPHPIVDLHDSRNKALTAYKKM